MRNIECTVTLNVLDEAGEVIGTRQASIVGRVYSRTPTDDNACPWQLHDYRAYEGGEELRDISGADGDAIKTQAETFATNTPEPPPAEEAEEQG